MYKKYLPSKKIAIVLGVLCLLAVGLAYFFSKLGNSSVAGSENNTNVEVVALEDLNNRDTDGDGVKDWEEALWGTDPNKKDTAGDGVGDFATIAKKRQIIVSGNANVTTNTTSTVTDIFAQQFFSSVASLKQAGGLTKENIDTLAQTAVTNLTVPTDPIRYKIENVRTIEATPETIATFKKELKKIATGLPVDTLGSEVVLLSKGINKPKNPKLEAQLKSISSTYALLAERSSRITVPSTMVNAYVDLINAYYGLSVATTGLSLVYTDPVQSVQALSLHRTQTTKLSDAIDTISAYLKE